MNSSQTYPGLRIWIAVIAVAVFVIGCFEWLYVRHHHYVFYTETKNRISHFFEKPNQRKKVILIGNSLARHAIPFNLENYNPDFDFLRIQHSAFSFRDFLPVLDQLSAFDPDIIFIQTYLIYSNHSENEPRSNTLKYLLLPRSYTSNNLSYIKENTDSDDFAFQDQTPHYASEFEISTASRLTNADAEFFHTILRKMKSKKTKIHFINFPRKKKLNLTFNYEKDLFPLTQNYQRPIDIFSELPDSLYIDRSHLNYQGRLTITPRLIFVADSLLRIP